MLLLYVVVIDMCIGVEVVLLFGVIVLVVLVSVVIFGVFLLVCVGDCLLIDGGVVNNMLIFVVIWLGVICVVVLLVGFVCVDCCVLCSVIEYVLNVLLLLVVCQFV